jgi:hypothetical protein
VTAATRHDGFTFLNRVVNPLVRWLIRSPLHRLASRRLALITYTGPRSGRRYTIPVGYQMAGAQVTINVASPDRKGVVAEPQGHGSAGRAACSRSAANR